ncbi:hypothetical protein [Bradyrhizobium sp. SRS-191]|uniref:hypothetical protein n=1 Tax=Bradyrhizobium sp. SRS-191 TaxID=2962606 RepID=UPI00211F444A|nr:hypothetical protein [Bradyrhizobium sp. SRS-191]
MLDPRSYSSADDTAAEIRSEETQLRKAVADISEGRMRLRNQQLLVAEMHERGTAPADCSRRETAERLTVLLRDSLIEWDRHRVLIEQRLAYLYARHRRELKS